MNPVFWALVIIIAAAIWFLMACIFYPLGRFLWRIGSDAMSELNKDDKENKDERKEKEL